MGIEWPLPAGVKPKLSAKDRRGRLRGHREISLKVLVLGGGGQVANAVAACAPAAHAVVVKTRRDVDIADAAALDAAVAQSGADWIVNGAAYTAVDRAESEADAAHAVNDAAVATMARAAARSGGRLLHLSTDFVFDGSRTGPICRPTRPIP